MYDLDTFRRRVLALCKEMATTTLGRPPTQADLARAIGLSRTELSRRLNGSGDVRLTCDNAKAIVRQLAAWGTLQTQAAALDLLDLLHCPPFSTQEWQAAPLTALASSPLRVPFGRRANNLPIAFNSFIGREVELATAQELLANARLLTISGVGGVGKSRFAVELANRLRDRYPEGTWLVKLAPLKDSRLVGAVSAATLGLHEEPGRTIAQTICDYLRPRQMLLILDNCEHLLAPVAAFAELLLTACPHLAVIATSREPLSLPSESRLRLPSLTTPPPQAQPAVAQVSDYEAVRLFVARAKAVRPSFRLTSQNVAPVAQICARLDGIPLAIELAATQLEGLSLEKLAQRLDHRLTSFASASSTAMPHQQTLRASIEWSYELLSPAEQALLRRLSIFASGWSLEAAEAACAGDFKLPLATDNPVAQSNTAPVGWAVDLQSSEVLTSLLRLVNKSLVVATVVDEPSRYHLLETIHEFASEKLRASGEAEAMGRQHAALYLTLAEAAEEGLIGVQQGEWLTRLEAEHDNLRAALSWTLSHNREGAARLVAGVWRFWSMRGYLSEGRSWLETTLAQSSPTPSPLRANLLNAAGWLAAVQGDYAAAAVLLHQSLTMAQAVGSIAAQAKALNSLGVLAWNLADYPAAERLLGESLSLRRSLNDRWGMTQSLNNLAIIAAEQGDYRQAAQMYAQNLAIQRELGDSYGISASLNNLAATALYEGDYATAQPAAEECLLLSHEQGDQDGIALALLNLASALLFQQAYDAANDRFDECLALMRALGDQTGIVQSLTGLANVARQQASFGQATARYKEALTIAEALDYKLGAVGALEGLALVAVAVAQAEQGARLLGAAAALRQAINVPLHTFDRHEYEQAVVTLRQQLDGDRFDQQWASGQALALAIATADALSLEVLAVATTLTR